MDCLARRTRAWHHQRTPAGRAALALGHTPEHAPSAASSGRLAEPPVCPGQGRNPSNQAACSRWRVVCGFWLRSGRSAA
ncbi:hypothetical protein P910_001339 [Xylella fastidiosa Mul-MD]|nr:hypothetical protein P303_07865 [Xylella fastidiosa MUL0034]AIC13929.1 hypothetical protein P303_08115 [Xylella fastidiosa MUL0034]EWG15516.1 hypothetical protein P910_001339 [Xylella fastidiosa Mul-MD]TNV94234.1 hypothetical protein C5H22_09305 [Xylella fastidiosa]